MTKKNQHYVWQFYLDPWKENNHIWCLRQRDDKLLYLNSRNIASQNYFYSVHDLTDDDRKYLTQAISKLKGARLESSQGFIKMFASIFEVKRLVADAKLGPELQAFQNHLDLAAKTAGEQYHTLVENSGLPIIEYLRAADGSLMDNEELFADFALFITTQYFRTAKMRNAVFTTSEAYKKILPNHDHKRTWPIESLILAANLGFTLFERRSRYRLTFLKNETSVPLITGDQPVINRNTGDDAELSFYYPISPRLGISYSPVSHAHSTDQVFRNSVIVEMLNDQIFSKSDDQIYSNEQSVLQRFRQRNK